MNVGLLVLVVLGIAVAGYVLGRQRSLSSAGGDVRQLHSLPGYYGQSVFLFAAVPSLLVLAVWLFAQPLLIENRVSSMIQPSDIKDGSTLGLVMADVRRISNGLDVAVAQGALTEDEIDNMRADLTNVRGRLADVGVAVGSDVSQNVFVAAKEFRSLTGIGRMAMSIVVLALAIGGAVYAFSRITPRYRARNVSETAIKGLMILSSTVAILTTLGIVTVLAGAAATGIAINLLGLTP